MRVRVCVYTHVFVRFLVHCTEILTGENSWPVYLRMLLLITEEKNYVRLWTVSTYSIIWLARYSRRYNRSTVWLLYSKCVVRASDFRERRPTGSTVTEPLDARHFVQTWKLCKVWTVLNTFQAMQYKHLCLVWYVFIWLKKLSFIAFSFSFSPPCLLIFICNLSPWRWAAVLSLIKRQVDRLVTTASHI